MTNDDDLGDDLERVVADLVEKGRYSSRAALLQEGVRLVEEREALLTDLDRSISEAIASPATTPIGPRALSPS